MIVSIAGKAELRSKKNNAEYQATDVNSSGKQEPTASRLPNKQA
jgi:hypothetical protein